MSDSSKADNFKMVFGSDIGKSVLADLLLESNVNGVSFIPGFSDQTAFNEGARSIGVYIQSMISLSNEDIQRLLSKARIERDIEGQKRAEEYTQ